MRQPPFSMQNISKDEVQVINRLKTPEFIRKKAVALPANEVMKEAASSWEVADRRMTQEMIEAPETVKNALTALRA